MSIKKFGHSKGTKAVFTENLNVNIIVVHFEDKLCKFVCSTIIGAAEDLSTLCIKFNCGIICA